MIRLFFSFNRCHLCCGKALKSIYTHDVDVTYPKAGLLRWLDVDVFTRFPGRLRVVEKNEEYSLGIGPKTKASFPPCLPGISASVRDIRSILTGRASRYAELKLSDFETNRATALRILELARDGYDVRFLKAVVYGMKATLPATRFFRKNVNVLAKQSVEVLTGLLSVL